MTYPQLMVAQPSTWNAAAAPMGTSNSQMQQFGQIIQVATAALTSLKGQTGTANTQGATQIVQLMLKVAAGMMAAQATTTAGAAGITAAQTGARATTQMASGQGYAVIPSPMGTVLPGPPQYAAAATNPGLMGTFQAIARAFTGQLNTSVATGKATDAKTAAQLAAIVMQFLSTLLNQSNSSSSTTPTTTPTTTTIPTTTLPATSIPGSVPPGTQGTTLAGVGTLAGATAMSGAIPAANVRALGGAAGSAMVGVPPGVMVGATAPGLAGAGAAGAPSATVAPTGTSVANNSTMVGGARGGAYGGHDEADHEAEGWLLEDRPVWTQGDAPDGLLH